MVKQLSQLLLSTGLFKWFLGTPMALVNMEILKFSSFKSSIYREEFVRLYLLLLDLHCFHLMKIIFFMKEC